MAEGGEEKKTALTEDDIEFLVNTLLATGRYDVVPRQHVSDTPDGIATVRGDLIDISGGFPIATSTPALLSETGGYQVATSPVPIPPKEFVQGDTITYRKKKKLLQTPPFKPVVHFQELDRPRPNYTTQSYRLSPPPNPISSSTQTNTPTQTPNPFNTTIPNPTIVP